MTLTALVERYAQFEKQGVGFYRALADRFRADTACARIWREMSNTEASHFALLALAQDWIAMAKAAPDAPPVAPEDLERLAARMAGLERAAEREDCGLAEAVNLTIAWEELELPRIVELVRYLPAPAQERVRAGMIAETAEHCRMLMELVKVAGAPSLAERVAALASDARSALG